jgi:anti-sigma-K factor RskA
MNRDEEMDELLGAYALGALDELEQVRVERYLAQSPLARQELARYDHVVHALAEATIEPELPEGAWNRLADVLFDREVDPAVALPPLRLAPEGSSAAAPAAISLVAPVVELRRPARWPRSAVVAMAAALVVAIGVFGYGVRQQQRLSADRSASAEVRLRTAAQHALGDTASKVGTLTSPQSGAQVRVVIDRDGHGFLLADTLPALPAGRTYQLWSLDASAPISLGVIGAHPTVVSFPGAGAPRSLAITAEADPGVASPSGTPLVAGTLS